MIERPQRSRLANHSVQVWVGWAALVAFIGVVGWNRQLPLSVTGAFLVASLSIPLLWLAARKKRRSIWIAALFTTLVLASLQLIALWGELGL